MMAVGSAAERGVQWFIAEPTERESKHCRVYCSCSVSKTNHDAEERGCLVMLPLLGCHFPCPVNTASGISCMMSMLIFIFWTASQ